MKKSVAIAVYVLLILAVSILVSGCTKTVYIDSSSGERITDVKSPDVEDFFDYKTVVRSIGSDVVMDDNTGCLYYATGYKMTPIMEPDGTVLTYDEWKEKCQKLSK